MKNETKKEQRNNTFKKRRSSKNQPKKVLLVTECTMSDNVQVDNPNVQFVKPCNLCPHMNRITLNKIYDCLKNETNEIKIGHNIAEIARKSVLRMAEIGR